MGKGYLSVGYIVSVGLAVDAKIYTDQTLHCINYSH